MSDDENMERSSENSNVEEINTSSSTPSELRLVSSSSDDSNDSGPEDLISFAQSQFFEIFSRSQFTNPFLRDWDRMSESGNDEETVPPKVLLKAKPKHNWFMMKEVIQREYQTRAPPSRFTRRYYGSLHAVRRLELMYKLEDHTGCVNAINFNESGTRLISGSDDRTVRVWDWSIGKSVTQFNTGHTSNVFQCKYLPLCNDSHIVTCSRDGQVRLALRHSNGSYKCHTKLAQHNKACHKLATIPHSPDVVLSAGEDALVYSIDVREKKPTRMMHVREKKRKICLYSIHANPMTGNEFCVSGEDYYVRIYDRRFIRSNGVAEIKFKPNIQTDDSFSVYVTCAVFNHNGTEVIGSYNDDDIYLFDAKHASNMQFVHKYEGHRNAETVKGVNFYGPKSEYVISGSDCGNIYIWDKNTEGIVQWMRGDEEGVINCLEPHPHIPVLATSGMDPDVKIWIPSCETDPAMENLDSVIRMNHSNRGDERASRSTSLRRINLSLLNRWWRNLRERRQNSGREDSLSGNERILVSLDSGSLPFIRDDSSSSSSSSSSSNSSTASADF